jgi:uncharacterized protein (TIGR00290 family)
MTTMNREAERVAMHAVRSELLHMQASAAGLPLQEIRIPSPCTNADYESILHTFLTDALRQGIDCIAFGDLFLEDVRAYRERQLAAIGLTPLFPLWGSDTRALADEMIDGGLRARITCVDPRQVPAALAGRDFDQRFLRDLPRTADPCGERGEFHTFVYAGPMFAAPIAVECGEVVERDGFVFSDLLAASPLSRF